MVEERKTETKVRFLCSSNSSSSKVLQQIIAALGIWAISAVAHHSRHTYTGGCILTPTISKHPNRRRRKKTSLMIINRFKTPAVLCSHVFLTSKILNTSTKKENVFFFRGRPHLKDHADIFLTSVV